MQQPKFAFCHGPLSLQHNALFSDFFLLYLLDEVVDLDTSCGVALMRFNQNALHSINLLGWKKEIAFFQLVPLHTLTSSSMIWNVDEILLPCIRYWNLGVRNFNVKLEYAWTHYLGGVIFGPVSGVWNLETWIFRKLNISFVRTLEYDRIVIPTTCNSLTIYTELGW